MLNYLLKYELEVYMSKKDQFASLVLFTLKEAEDLYEKKESVASSLSRYVKTGKVVRIKRDLYAAIDPMTGSIYANKFEIASKATETSYVSYHSALEYWGLATQVFNTVYFSSDKRVSNYGYSGIDYVGVNSPFEEGILEKQNNSIIRVTDLERTLIDCIDKIDLAGGFEEIVEGISYLRHVKEDKLLNYLRIYNKNFLYQKTGYFFSSYTENLLSKEFFRECKEKMGERKSYIDTFVKGKRKLVKEWNLIVPETYL